MIHPSSDVKAIRIGANTNIWQYCVIFPEASIGKNCNICAYVLIENNVIIGDNVTIKSGVQIWDGVRILDNVFIGPNVTFTNDLVPRSKSQKWNLTETYVNKGSTIGANSTVLAGRIIGEYALVGAGSVVTRDVPAHAICYGNPAIQKGYITRSGILLDMDLKDKEGLYHSLEE
jgi:acetyltransferase-like isoleucine patch superfamily enzyme